MAKQLLTNIIANMLTSTSTRLTDAKSKWVWTGQGQKKGDKARHGSSYGRGSATFPGNWIRFGFGTLKNRDLSFGVVST